MDQCGLTGGLRTCAALGQVSAILACSDIVSSASAVGAKSPRITQELTVAVSSRYYRWESAPISALSDLWQREHRPWQPIRRRICPSTRILP